MSNDREDNGVFLPICQSGFSIVPHLEALPGDPMRYLGALNGTLKENSCFWINFPNMEHSAGLEYLMSLTE